MICPNCGKELKDGAKFCGVCGTKLNTEIKEIKKEDIDVSGKCLHWNILPGQLAVKIDYKTLAGYGNVKGIIIQEGTKALVFSNGAYVGELEGDRYLFKNILPVSPEDPSSGFKRVFGGLKDFFKSEKAKQVENQESITFVLLRNTDFPLIFEFQNLVTGQVTSNSVAIHTLAKISNIIEFYKQTLLDREFVSFESIAKNLETAVLTSVEQFIRDKNPDQIGNADCLSEMQGIINKSVGSVYPFISIQSVVRVTAENTELEELRAMREELYIDEGKLTELQKRNNYLNRLTDENNAQILLKAQTQADFTAAMDKIDQQNLLSEDEKSRFAMTLHAQRQIREAQSDDQVQAAMAELQKAGILRTSEIEDLAHQITQKNQLRDLTDAQAINLLTLQNERVLDTEKLAWEIEIGNKRFQNQLDRQRMMDEYNDSRRRAQIDLDKEEQMSQLEMLRQAQAIRQEKEDAEHKREMDKLELARQAHKDDLDAENEKNRIYAGMSAEQIMAANPDISPAAAAALAAKFSNDNAVEAQKQINEAQKQNTEQMMGMMQQFMNQMQADKAADREQQLKYMEMMANQNNVQMQQMGAMASNMAMGKSQETDARLKDKDEELARMDKSSERHQDRMLDAMQTTINAVSGKTPNVASSKGTSTCPSCGAPVEPGSSFCAECGASI